MISKLTETVPKSFYTINSWIQEDKPQSKTTDFVVELCLVLGKKIGEVYEDLEPNYENAINDFLAARAKRDQKPNQ